MGSGYQDGSSPDKGETWAWVLIYHYGWVVMIKFVVWLWVCRKAKWWGERKGEAFHLCQPCFRRFIQGTFHIQIIFLWFPDLTIFFFRVGSRDSGGRERRVRKNKTRIVYLGFSLSLCISSFSHLMPPLCLTRHALPPHVIAFSSMLLPCHAE